MYRQEDIIGIWRGEHQGKELLFEFKSDQTCVLSFSGKVLATTVILSGNFNTDFSKKPIMLSVRNITQLNHPLHTILEFVNGNSIRIAKFVPRWKLRPISFDLNTSMELKRVNN